MSVSQEQLDIASHSPATALADYLRRSISLSELLARAWSGRLIVIVSALLFMALGAGYVSYAGPKYVATMWVSPAESDAGGGGASGLLAQLSDSSEASSVPKFTQFLSSIPSAGVAKQLDKKYGMVCRVFRNTCDQITHQWHPETGMRAWVAGITAKLGGLPDPNGARTASDLAGYIATKVDINQNKKNAIVILSYSDSKPERAAQFLAAVVSSANDYIKSLNHQNERQYVAYLVNMVSKTTNVEQRQILDTLLLQHERQLMMTEVDVPYAATILEGPSVTPVNQVMKILLAFAFLGSVIGLLAVLFRPQKLRHQHA